MTATIAPVAPAGTPSADGFARPAARGVDQVPHRARLGHRHGRRGAGDRGFRAVEPHRPARSVRQHAARRHRLPDIPLGPGGEAVTDSFYFVHQPLAGDGSITARVTSLTGQTSPTARPRQGGGRHARPACRRGPRPGSSSRRAPRPGSAYAAMMVTGSHGVRMQYDFTERHRRACPAPSPRRLPALAAADPLRRHDHRLRLRRRHALDQGRHRHPGRAAADRPGRPVRHLAALPADLSSVDGERQRRPQPGHRRLRPRQPDRAPAPAALDRRRAQAADGRRGSGHAGRLPARPAGTFTVTGSGDIAPAVPGRRGRRRHRSRRPWWARSPG